MPASTKLSFIHSIKQGKESHANQKSRDKKESKHKELRGKYSKSNGAVRNTTKPLTTIKRPKQIIKNKGYFTVIFKTQKQ